MTEDFKLTPIAQDYEAFLQVLKDRIRQAQVKAALAVNRELVLLYWQIGKDILDRQREGGWGSKVIERLAKDLKREFPGIKGFSRSNLMYMRAFADAYPQEQIIQGPLGQIPWYQNIALLEKLKSTPERLWYAHKTIENGWSRNVLVAQIESNLFQRQGSAISNFEQTLPAAQSDLAKQIIKSPYNFDFLTLTDAAVERDLEQGLVNHIREFLLELGLGFAFLGSQYPLEVDSKDYKLDLLFFHIKLRCFIVIDLKMGEFLPEYSGKMNFYVSAVDDLLKNQHDNPTIGIILCKSKSKTTAEYALRNLSTPIAISTHQLPEGLQANLPSVEQLEMEMDAAMTTLKQQTSETDQGTGS